MNRNSIVQFFSALILMLVFISCGKKEAADQNDVVIWHWITDKDAIFQELASKYESETGTPVRFELYAPSDAYTQKVRAASQANRLPEVFGLLAEKHDLASFIKAGYLRDLSPELDAENAAWRSSLFAKALAHDAFEEGNEYEVKAGTYGIPIDLMTIQMVYNKKLFKQAGLDPEHAPQTWSELMTVTEKLKAAGIKPFVCGFAELWMMDCLASNYAFNILGEEKVIDTYRGNVPYTDPQWIEVLGVFEALYKAGFFVEGVTNFTNKEAEQMFAYEKAAMAFNGSWAVNVYPDMNPDLDYGVFLPPAFSAEYPMRVWGSAGAGFLVNGSSEKSDQAIAFLKWLTAPEQQSYMATKTNNLPSNKQALADISPVLSQFAAAFENSTHPSRWAIMETAAVIEAFDKGIQLIIIGEKSAEEVAREVQSIKAREMERANS